MTGPKVLAEYGGVKIVSSEDTLGGNPRIEETRIGPHHVGPLIDDDRDAVEIAEEVYPHLTPSQVEAAYAYYMDHPEEMEQIRRLKEDVGEIVSAKVYQCECGERFRGTSTYADHVSEVEVDGHSVIETSYEEVVFECDCARQFETADAAISHRSENPEHSLATVRYVGEA